MPDQHYTLCIHYCTLFFSVKKTKALTYNNVYEIWRMGTAKVAPAVTMKQNWLETVRHGINIMCIFFVITEQFVMIYNYRPYIYNIIIIIFRFQISNVYKKKRYGILI